MNAMHLGKMNRTKRLSIITSELALFPNFSQMLLFLFLFFFSNEGISQRFILTQALTHYRIVIQMNMKFGQCCTCPIEAIKELVLSGKARMGKS
jgi:hypothetical protein